MNNAYAKWLGSLPTALCLVCTVAAVYLCLSLGHQIWEDSQRLTAPNEAARPSANPQTARMQGMLSIREVAKLNLMGEASSQRQTSIVQKDLPETRLRLVLLGTFASTDSNKSSALIAEKDKPSVRYFINDSLPGGATLKEVLVDGVVLSRNGRRERLHFPKGESVSANKLEERSIANRTNKSSNTPSSSSQPRTETIKQRLENLRKNKRQ